RHSSARLSWVCASTSAAGAGVGAAPARRWYCRRVASLAWTFFARSDRKPASATPVYSAPPNRTTCGSALIIRCRAGCALQAAVGEAEHHGPADTTQVDTAKV